MERLHIDFSKVEVVSIFLGNRCNMSCPYCHRDDTGTSPVVSNKLKNILAKTGKIKIFFYGGEPTLYMDIIKEIVEVKPNADYYITTNGKLFDKYKDYFSAHNFFVVFSYDGKCSERGFDPLTKPIEIDKFGVSSTLTRNHCDIKQWARDINEKENIIKRPIYAYPHHAHTLVYDNECYALDVLQIIKLANDEIKAIKQMVSDYEKFKLVNIRWKSLLSLLVKRIHHTITDGETRCANHKNVKLDLDGNMYECLYKREPYVGTPIKCTACNLFKYCGSGCSKELFRERECKYNQLLLGWFVKFYEEHKEACNEIVCFSESDHARSEC